MPTLGIASSGASSVFDFFSPFFPFHFVFSVSFILFYFIFFFFFAYFFILFHLESPPLSTSVAASSSTSTEFVPASPRSTFIPISNDDLDILKQIGVGAYATVHEALLAGERVAVKKINQEPEGSNGFIYFDSFILIHFFDSISIHFFYSIFFR